MCFVQPEGPHSASATTPSLSTDTTAGMTRELSVESACHAYYHHETAPIPEEPIPSVISDVPSIELSLEEAPPRGIRHTRKKSGCLDVKEYLQAEGASCNRGMVSIQVSTSCASGVVYGYLFASAYH